MSDPAKQLDDPPARDRANALVRRSFIGAMRDPAVFGQSFYDRLFELAPQLRTLFPADLQSQQHKLVQALHVLVRQLEHPDTLEPVLRQLGDRHVSYGVRPAHFAVVGEALIDTLDRLAEQPLDAETRDAWIRLYSGVASTMIRGASRHQ
jgi:hemoglobin-like flavoprotein